MATDKSEPRTGFIFKIGILFVVTLIAVRGGLVSYFDHMSAGEALRKVEMAKPEALMNLRADESERLGSGPEPIAKAMQDLAAKGRMGANPAIMPSASRDLAPLQGAAMMPALVPAPMVAMAARAPAPEPSAIPATAADGGVDGAASTPAAAPDGGHPRGPAGPGHLPHRP